MAATPYPLTANSGSAATSHNTASFAIVTGECYVIFVEGNAASIPTPTVSGLSQTWTQIGSTVAWDNQGAGNTRKLTVFACVAGSTTSGAATIDWGATSTVAVWSVIRVVGQVAGAISAVIATPVAANSESGATSGSISNFTLQDPQSCVLVATSHRANEATTPKSGWQELSDTALSSTHNLQVQWHANDASPSASWGSSVKWAMIALEVLPNPNAGLLGVDRSSGATNTGSQTTLVVTPQSNFRRRSWAVLVCSYDNSGTNGADPYASISDSAGNTWTPQINSLIDPGAADAGQCLRFFTSDMAVAPLTTAHTITVSFGATVVSARSYALHEVTPDSSGLVSYVTGGQETAATGTPTITTGSITAGDMVIAAVGREGNEAPTGDTDTTNGEWSALLGGRVGTTTAGSQCVSQRKVVTGTGTQTYNPTFGGTSRDGCEAYIVLTESLQRSSAALLALPARRRRM